MDAMCAARDAIMARTAGYDWYWIILYLLIIALFLFTAHQTYYKYILPRLNPNFVPNREFIKKNVINSSTDILDFLVMSFVVN